MGEKHFITSTSFAVFGRITLHVTLLNLKTCSNICILPNLNNKVQSKPNYESSGSFFLG